MGKLPNTELKKLLNCIKKDPRVLIPPTIGYDSGVHRMGDKYVVVSTDPCTGVPDDWFGWLLVNYAASDVALFGARPEFCTINLLGPSGTKLQIFQKIMAQACRAADELNMAIITGHTGYYENICETIGVCMVYGTVEPDRLLTPGNAKKRDLILCTKPLGLETLTNLSLIRKTFAQELFGIKESERLANSVQQQSCVKEALLLAGIKGVHAMHDATEGGFVSALNEMADASKLGFKIDIDKLPISSQILKLQEAFELTQDQVLSMSSTGMILAAVDPEAKQEVSDALHNKGVEPVFVGVFTKEKKRLLFKEEKEMLFPRLADDCYARIIRKKA